jgi:GT2 family glycosyltransferase
LAGARGDVIVRVDGHTIIEPDYVRQCVEALQRTGAENVGGRMDPVGTTPFGKAVALATSSPFGVGGARFHYSTREEWVDTVYLGAWPRAVFDAIGGFDEEQVRNQDDELNYRLRELGGRVLLTPLIRSQYFNRGNVRSLWRQYYEYGFWKVRVMQKHPKQMQIRQFIPACFVLGLGTLLAASPFHIIPRLLLGTVAVLYTGSSALATAKITPKKQDRHLRPMIAFSFAVLHVAYGAGFLAGLLRFRAGWKNTRYGSGSKTNVPNCGAV